MPLHIIHFSQDFRKDKGQLGAFSRTYTLTKDGNKHIIFTIHFDDETISHDDFDHLEIISIGIGKRELRGRFERSLSIFIGEKMLSYLLKNQIQVDILYGHAQLINFKILQFVNQKLHKPLVWDVNTIWGLPLFEEGQFLFKLYYFLFAHFAYRKCTHLIAQTEQCKQVIHRSYGIMNNKITVVTNSVNFDRFRKRKQYCQSFSNKSLNIFFVGRFDELNGIDFILDNIYLFDPKRINIHLVGSGSNLDRINHLQKAGRLKYHGVVPFSKMPEIFLEADLLLIPRIRCFGSNLFIPTKLLEGMASGLLVLGSDVGGISEVLQDDQNGFLFHSGNPEDMIEKINKITTLSSHNLQEISDSAVRTIRNHFNMKKECQTINSMYEKIISSL